MPFICLCERSEAISDLEYILCLEIASSDRENRHDFLDPPRNDVRRPHELMSTFYYYTINKIKEGESDGGTVHQGKSGQTL